MSLDRMMWNQLGTDGDLIALISHRPKLTANTCVLPQRPPTARLNVSENMRRASVLRG